MKAKVETRRNAIIHTVEQIAHSVYRVVKNDYDSKKFGLVTDMTRNNTSIVLQQHIP